MLRTLRRSCTFPFYSKLPTSKPKKPQAFWGVVGQIFNYSNLEVYVPHIAKNREFLFEN
jgi:hypothetical protein